MAAARPPGDGLNTQFISVLEPYGHEPFIKSARTLQSIATAEKFAAAVEVVLADGQRDVVLVSEHPGPVEGGGVSMNGRLGFARFREDGQAIPGDEIIAEALIAGDKLSAGGRDLALPAPAVTGKLVGWDDSDVANTLLKLDTALPREGLVGRYIIFDNEERSDASYRIEDVRDDHVISVGGNSLAERFVDPADYSKAIVHTIAPGDRFVIPLSACWKKAP